MKSIVANLLVVVVLCGGMLKAEASANVKFYGTNVYYASEDKSVVCVEGKFVNEGDQTATVDQVNIKLQCTDPDGVLFLNDNVDFFSVNAVVVPGKEKPWNFFIHKSQNTGYDGPFKYYIKAHVSFTNWE